MIKYQLKSGKLLEIDLVPTGLALELYRAVMSECALCKFDLKIEEDTSLLELVGKNSEALLRVLGSENVMEVVQRCCAKVIYGKKKFSMDLFDDIEARGDFFGIMIIVALENLLPFFPHLRSRFEMLLSQFVM